MTTSVERAARLAQLHARAASVSEHGRREDLVPICEAILAIDPDCLDSLQFLGMWQLERGAYAEAARTLGRLAELAPQDHRVRLPLATALEETGQPRAALEHARRALESNRDNYFPYLYLGSIFERLGDIERASFAYSTAARLGTEDETLVDDPSVPDSARERARRGNALIDRFLRELHARAVAKVHAARPEADLERIAGARWLRMHTVPVTPTNPVQGPKWFYVPLLDRTGWFEREEFEWVEALESRAPDILAEVTQRYRIDEDTVPYLTSDSDDQEPDTLVNSTDWGACRFYNGFQRSEDTCRRFPVTATILDGLPLFRVEGNTLEAFYSVLRARAHITPHQSASNVRLTVHLPLVVPEHCTVTVQGEARQTEFGRCLIFDDTAMHEARNDSDEARIVLIFQIWHPDLREEEREVIAASHAAHERWLRERRFEQLLVD